ncbi:MAG: hypothetical protein WC346_06340, partial [Methanogenium sp.]
KGNVNLYSLTNLPDNKYNIFKNDGVVHYNNYDSKFDARIREAHLRLECSLKFAEDLSFNKYDKDRGQQYVNQESDKTVDNPLDMQQSYHTDYFLPDLDHDKKERESLDWTNRENLQFAFGSLKLNGGDNSQDIKGTGWVSPDGLHLSWAEIPEKEFYEYIRPKIKIGDKVLFVGKIEDAKEFFYSVFAEKELGEDEETDQRILNYIKIIMHEAGVVEDIYDTQDVEDKKEILAAAYQQEGGEIFHLFDYTENFRKINKIQNIPPYIH